MKYKDLTDADKHKVDNFVRAGLLRPTEAYKEKLTDKVESMLYLREGGGREGGGLGVSKYLS